MVDYPTAEIIAVVWLNQNELSRNFRVSRVIFFSTIVRFSGYAFSFLCTGLKAVATTAALVPLKFKRPDSQAKCCSIILSRLA